MAEPIRSIDRTTMLAHLGAWSLGAGPLYVRLAKAITAAVERGDIAPGSRLPAERPLGRSLTVSRGTVMAAYERLREIGIADSRQGSGTWIRVDAGRPISRLNDIDVRSRQLFARLLEDTQAVIDLTISAVSHSTIYRRTCSTARPATRSNGSGVVTATCCSVCPPYATASLPTIANAHPTPRWIRSR